MLLWVARLLARASMQPVLIVPLLRLPFVPAQMAIARLMRIVAVLRDIARVMEGALIRLRWSKGRGPIITYIEIITA